MPWRATPSISQPQTERPAWNCGRMLPPITQRGVINSGSSNSNPGRNTHMLIGDTLYFDADDGSTGSELWAYDISNDSAWRLTDIHAGSGNGLLGWQVVQVLEMLIDDTFYFTAQDGTDMEVWAHQPYEITPLTARWPVCRQAARPVSPRPPIRAVHRQQHVHHQRYTNGGLKQHDLHGHGGHQRCDLSDNGLALQPQPTTHAERRRCGSVPRCSNDQHYLRIQ